MGGQSAALILYATLLSSLSWMAANAAAATPPAAAVGPPAGAAPQQLEEIAVIGERPGPRLWKVSKGDHVLWLLGTLTHLPKRMTWRSSEVESALAESQELVSGPSVSADVGPIGAIRLYVQWRRTQKSPDRLKLNVWLPAPLYARFEALKARFDAGDGGIEELRPSIAALRLYERAVDAAGLTTGHDEVEQAVVKLAKRRRVPIQRVELKVNDPSGALKEVSALPPTVEIDCVAATITRIETDLPSMQERAKAWAVGDVDRLRALPYPNQREVCLSALSNSPRIKGLVDSVVQAWRAEAESALTRNRVSFAMRPIYELLDPDGPLAKFRAAGCLVEGP
jgi:uncharacterized protein YbaP (TraB family)